MKYAFERIEAQGNGWAEKINLYPDSTVFQTPAWLAFISQTQNAAPVIAALKEGNETIGYFTGLTVRKFGLKILGSPFPGWTTDYMGLSLSTGACRRLATQALMDFAFQKLGCSHLEMMDRNLTIDDLSGLNVQYRLYRGFQIDLTPPEHELFANMTSACRRGIRKAGKCGVTIEEAKDLDFADEYFSQLKDVFAKQALVPTYGVERVRQLINHIHPTGNLLLLRARDPQGRCIATGIFPHSNGVMYFWGGASWRHSHHLRPNEALHWTAMRLGKTMGIRSYDMGGYGEYKRKYGGEEIQVPWFRKSKHNLIEHMRYLAQRIHRARQWVLGQSLPKSLTIPQELHQPETREV